MRRVLLHYDLPADRIASRPPAERDGARLLVLDPGAAPLHAAIRDLDTLVPSGALLVVNDTRVVPARLLGRKRDTGGRVELLLLRRVALDSSSGPGAVERWSALGRASKGLRPGTEVVFADGAGDEVLRARIHAPHGAREGASPEERLLDVELHAREGSVERALELVGHVPLPPYIRRPDEALDRERYQTVFARAPGAVAAPTAGLHLSEALLARLEARGVAVTSVTLHVGLGTFEPVTVEDLDEHPMHAEAYVVSAAAAAAIELARSRGAPVIAVGTTVVRALETAADLARPGRVREGSGETRLLIQPGYSFRVVDQLLTNFHLPESTLLALVCAFGGHAPVLAAYRAAVEAGYRFFSYGDAMLLRGRVAAALAGSSS